MKDWIGEILALHGQTVTVRHAAGEVAVQAFVQPLTGRNEQVPDAMCGIGSLDGRLWLYLGQEEVQPEEQILWGGQIFRVRSSRVYHLSEMPLYWWASLEQEREAAE